MRAFQRTAALNAAIELDLFTAIGASNRSAAEIAGRVGAAERGVRILCDYLTIAGFLLKENGGYRLTPDSAMFLDRSSPAYLGTATRFMFSPRNQQMFAQLADAVRKGGTAIGEEGLMVDENPEWVEFARHMAPLMRMPAEWIADTVEAEFRPDQPLRVLDLAAGHGLFGITVARRMPQARIAAVDWANVLEVARENAARAGVADRLETRPGDAFQADYGSGYNLALVTNFLHHFDPPACVALLKKVRAALQPGGRIIALDFIPNEDRISPEVAASFAVMMLAGTPRGDAYTFKEYERMFQQAGFAGCELRQHPVVPEQLLLAR